MEDFEDLVVLRGNTEVISLNVLMAFTAYGQNFCQFKEGGGRERNCYLKFKNERDFLH